MEKRYLKIHYLTKFCFSVTKNSEQKKVIIKCNYSKKKKIFLPLIKTWYFYIFKSFKFEVCCVSFPFFSDSLFSTFTFFLRLLIFLLNITSWWTTFCRISVPIDTITLYYWINILFWKERKSYATILKFNDLKKIKFKYYLYRI